MSSLRVWRAAQVALLVVALAAVLLGASKVAFASAMRPAAAIRSSPPTFSQEARELPQGQPIEREIKGGESHVYRIQLAAGQYLRIEVEQRGADVALTMVGPDNQSSGAMNRIWRLIGTEAISVVAETAGEYLLKVNAPNRDYLPGRYEARIKELREAAAQDRLRIEAERAFADGGRLAGQQTDEGHRQAIERYKEALRLWQETGDRPDQVNALLWVCARYQSVSEFSQSLDYCRQALALSRTIGDRVQETRALTGIASSYYGLGDRQKAMDIREQSLLLARETGDRVAESYALGGFATSYLRLGEYQKSIEYQEQAMVVHKAFVGMGQGMEAIYLNNLALPYIEMGQHQKAIEYLAQALGLFRADDDAMGQVIALENLGECYAGLGDVPKAFDHYRQSLALARSRNYRGAEATPLKDLGDLHASLREDEQAMEYYRQSLAIRREQQQSLSEAEVVAAMARVEHHRGNLIEAREHIEAALNLFESARANLLSPDFRASFFATRQKDYEFYIALLMQMNAQQPQDGNDGAALRASERARARSLLDLLSLSGIDLLSGIDPALKQRERELQTRFSRLQTQLMQVRSQASPDRTRAAQLEGDLKQADNNREQIETEIRRKHPQYANLEYPAPLGLAEIQQLLDERAALLEYSLGADGSFLFVVTKREFLTARLPSASALLDRVQKLRDAIAIKPNRATLANYLAHARWLHQQLIEPAKKLLAGKQELIIVPDASLHYLPFETLLTSTIASNDLSRLPYLVRDYSIRYAPSASVLAQLGKQRQSRPAATKAFLAFADPVYGEANQDSATGTALRSTIGEANPLQLRRLENSRKEVEGIGKLFAANEVELFLGDKACEENVKAGSTLEQFRYVHFAVHGLLNENQPRYSGLVLSMLQSALNRTASRTQPSGEFEDGLLQVYEIFNLKLNADLVVLSACETGLGKQVKGEGIIGLTRAFLYAGSPSVVVSLWKVADASTAELMARFYAKMKDQSGSKSEALRQAQLEMIREGRFAHPFYWAPFVLVGQS